MKYSYVNIMNLYKNTIKNKKTKFIVKNTLKNKSFIKYLMHHNVITADYSSIKNLIIVHVKYDQKSSSILLDSSINSKTSYQRPFIKKEFKKVNNNFVLNFSSKKGNYERLLARFR